MSAGNSVKAGGGLKDFCLQNTHTPTPTNNTNLCPRHRSAFMGSTRDRPFWYPRCCWTPDRILNGFRLLPPPISSNFSLIILLKSQSYIYYWFFISSGIWSFSDALRWICLFWAWIEYVCAFAFPTLKFVLRLLFIHPHQRRFTLQMACFNTNYRKVKNFFAVWVIFFESVRKVFF